MALITGVRPVLTDSLRAAVFLRQLQEGLCDLVDNTVFICLNSNDSFYLPGYGCPLKNHKSFAICLTRSVSPLLPALTLGPAVDCCLHLEHMTNHVHAFDLKDCGLIVSLRLTMQLGMDHSNLFGTIWKWWRQVILHLSSNNHRHFREIFLQEAVDCLIVVLVAKHED